MAALTTDRTMEYREGAEIALPVAAATTIRAGDLVALDAGYLVPGDDAASTVFAGVARQYVDNSGGGDGDAVCLVRRYGLWRLPMASAITAANAGDQAYLAGDGEADLAANVTNNIYCGVIAQVISTTEAWVDIEPAVRQSAAAAHMADPAAAHAASAIAVADADGHTAADDVEEALAELYQDGLTAAHVIPVPLTAITQEDGAPLAKYSAGGATPGLAQLSDKEQVVAWDGNAAPEAVAVSIPLADPAIDETADLTVKLLAKMAGATDSPEVAMEAYFGAGDDDCAGAAPEVTGTGLAVYSMTIAAADVPAAPTALTLVMTPAAGDMTTDELHLHALWVETQRKLKTA